MRGVPRAVAAALLVRVSELHGWTGGWWCASRRRLNVGVARVVAASVIRGVRISAPVCRRTREDVVLVRHVPDAVNDGFLLRQRKLLAVRVVPRARSDAIPRVDGIWSLSAEVGVPR